MIIHFPFCEHNMAGFVQDLKAIYNVSITDAYI
uniref:Uncharacterized protein n=1 Tax=Anguilla anguilla TaxID=7936 RepID=A0A0E9PBE8_ANGAN